jgi:hypothetical protein
VRGGGVRRFGFAMAPPVATRGDQNAERMDRISTSPVCTIETIQAFPRPGVGQNYFLATIRGGSSSAGPADGLPQAPVWNPCILGWSLRHSVPETLSARQEAAEDNCRRGPRRGPNARGRAGHGHGITPTDTRNPDYYLRSSAPVGLPAHTPVPEYIRLIAAGRQRRLPGQLAVERLPRRPRPNLRPCEPACRRGRVEDEPVASRLKRVAADNKDDIRDRLPTAPKGNGKRVARRCRPASLTVRATCPWATSPFSTATPGPAA